MSIQPPRDALDDLEPGDADGPCPSRVRPSDFALHVADGQDASSNEGERREAPRGRSGSRARFSTPVILIADDSEDNRDLFASVLARDGFEIATADDGVDALEVFAAIRPQVIVMDVAMPRMDGIEAVRRVRALGEDGAHVFIVVVSAFNDRASRAQAMEAGADAYLVKPCSPTNLVAAVRSGLTPSGRLRASKSA